MYIKEKLTDKQDLFCHEFMVDLNGTQAAIRSKYSEKTAQEQASRLLSNVMIQNRIQELKEKRSEKVEITAERVLKEIALLAFSNIPDYFKQIGNGSVYTLTLKQFEDMPEDASRAISGIEQNITKDGDIVYKVKLWDKSKNLEMLCRHLGIAKEQVQHGVDATSLAAIAKEVLKLREEAGK